MRQILVIIVMQKRVKRQSGMNEQLEIIDLDDERQECLHRITHLYGFSFCSSPASICSNRCLTDHKTDMFGHRQISLQQFEKAFKDLQLSFNQQSAHYVRQISKIESKSMETIRMNKQNCLKEIQGLKEEFMKKNYPDLQQLFPRLYQKYANRRLELLECREVHWVIHAHAHSQRHNYQFAPINKHFEKIINQFQKNVFKITKQNVSKQPAKQAKPQIKVIPQKSQLMTQQSGVKSVESHRLVVEKGITVRKGVQMKESKQIKPEHHIKQLQLVGQKLKQSIKTLYQQKQRLQCENDKLTNAINRKIYYLKEKSHRNQIHSQQIAIVYQQAHLNPLQPHQTTHNQHILPSQPSLTPNNQQSHLDKQRIQSPIYVQDELNEEIREIAQIHPQQKHKDNKQLIEIYHGDSEMQIENSVQIIDYKSAPNPFYRTNVKVQQNILPKAHQPSTNHLKIQPYFGKRVVVQPIKQYTYIQEPPQKDLLERFKQRKHSSEEQAIIHQSRVNNQRRNLDVNSKLEPFNKLALDLFQLEETKKKVKRD